MGSPYQSQSASGYNSSPPPDDGSTVSTNKITWATIKSKITDPLKTLADAVNTALRTALNITPSTTSTTYTTTVSDHMTTVEVTGNTTISLGDAATMVAQAMGYAVTVYNKGTGTVTVNLATGTNKINGNTNGAVSLASGQAMIFTVAQSGTDYEVKAAAGFAAFVLTGAAGTNTATANAPATLVGLYAGLQVIWTPAATNTGALTLNITPSGGSALTAKNVFSRGAACVGGEAEINVPYKLEYDGTQFNILGAFLKSGVLDVSAGTLGQIKFPATQNPSADVNTLDDYEEGSWTPSLGGNTTYTTQVGKYTKVGNLVTVKGQIVVNAIGTGSTGVISGLPFAAAAGFSQDASIGFFSASATNYTWIGGFITASTSSITLVATAAATASVTNPATVFGNGTNLVFSMTYST